MFPWSARRFEETRRAIGTFVAVTVEDRSATRAQEAIGRAFDEMERLAALLTRFEASSAVGVLNGEARLADPPRELVAVLQHGLELYRRTGGAFDPTVAPLVDLHQLHFAAHGGPPDACDVREVLELVGARHLQVEERAVAFERRGMALTLDGIGKGAIVDRMVETLAAQGIRHALVNAGGDLRALGARASGRRWRVGVQHPRQADRFSELIEVADAAVATSGDYVRFLDLERRYHHTIVPASGRSPQELASVSVRAPTAMAADALATAVFVLGADAGVALIDAVPAAECLLLRPDGGRTASAGW